MSGRAAILFYDGSCGLCVRSKDWLAARASAHDLRFVDIHDDAAMAQFPQINRERAQESVAMLRPDGLQAHGYEAASASMALVPRWRWAAGVMRMPVVRWVGRGVYRFVTRRRHRLSRALGWDE